MNIEIILHQHQGLRMRVMFGFQLNDERRIVLARTPLADLYETLTSMGLKGNQQMTDPMPFIVMIVAPFFARLHGQSRQGVAQQLARPLIHAPQGTLGVVGLGVPSPKSAPFGRETWASASRYTTVASGEA
ncbi:MAG: hypothetical protein R3E79_21340 [Caldilineaceae bacterium]